MTAGGFTRELYFDRDGKTAWAHVQHAGGALQNDLLVQLKKTFP